MYSVVMIEDEYWTLRGLLEIFPWEKYDMAISKTFMDAQEALPFIVQQQPDIVITDIEMPGLTGIELIRKLCERKVRSRVVVLSAHSNFAYAQELIRLGLFEYALKPLSRESADMILKRLKISLDQGTNVVTEMELHEKVAGNSRFNKIACYVNEHYAEKLTLNELCQIYNISPDYCNKLFRSYYGDNFSGYLKKIRLEKACALLRQNASIPEVAAATGYNDYYYFIKVFKKQYGITPYQYKNNN